MTLDGERVTFRGNDGQDYTTVLPEGADVRVCHGCGTTADGTELKLNLKTNAGNETRESIMALVQQQWGEVGIEVEIDAEPLGRADDAEVAGQSRAHTVRAIIEEAAGVLKFRKRKEKAERRLDATEANLLRLQDLLREVRRQLRPLERQAEAARRLRAQGIEPRLAGRRIYFADPDRIEVQLAASNHQP